MMDLSKYVLDRLHEDKKVHIVLELKDDIDTSSGRTFEYVVWIVDGREVGEIGLEIFEGIELMEVDI